MKLYLSEQDVLACFPWGRRSNGWKRISQSGGGNGGQPAAPPRYSARRLHTPLHGGGDAAYYGIKVYSTNPKSAAHFEVLLYRTEDGLPLATIEANRLGQIRTGAASGVATKYLARRMQRRGIIGSGFQAETQLEAIANVRKLREVRVWSRKAARREEFAERMAVGSGSISGRLPRRRNACVGRYRDYCDQFREPVLESAWIAPGSHINAAGSNWADRRELPTDLVLGAQG